MLQNDSPITFGAKKIVIASKKFDKAVKIRVNYGRNGTNGILKFVCRIHQIKWPTDQSIFPPQHFRWVNTLI